jgi:hypothetical protein
MTENGNGEDQDAVLAILRERARQLDLDIEILLGRRKEVLELITSIAGCADPGGGGRRHPRAPPVAGRYAVRRRFT